MPAKDPTIKAEVLEVVMTRIMTAPVEDTFDAWTDPAQVEVWWGSRAFQNQVQVWEARTGGPILLHMIAPCGTAFPVRGQFHEVKEPERIHFTSFFFEDEKGRPQLELLNTAIFTRYGRMTRITLQVNVIRSTPGVQDLLNGIDTGWKQSLDKLDVLLRERLSIKSTRSFHE